MKNISTKNLAALAFVVSAGGVQAADYDWGVHVLAPAQETAFAAGGGVVGAGSFLDTYLFSLATSGLQESSVVVAINLFTSNIANGSYSLFSTADYGAATFLDDVQRGSWSFDGTSGSTVNTVTNLASGNYYFAVSGVGGAGGGQYLLNSSVTAPIPEPEIYAMLGVGLGLLGWVGRRKKLKEAAAA